MNQNVIILSSNIYLPPWAYNLGHEIHMTRIILFDMLIKNKINKNDIIVTMNDRKFLYENVFNNIMDYNTALINNYLDWNKYNIINLFEIIVQYNCKDLLKIDYVLPDKYYNDELYNYIKNINYLKLDYDFLKNSYVIIHHRYDCDISKLKAIIQKLRNIFNDVHIIVFNNDKLKILSAISEYNNISTTDNLQEYASLLKEPNCKLVITEWSGGGQLAQYCSNANIIIYFDAYIISSNYVDSSLRLHEESMNGTAFQAWDFKTITQCKRFYYHNYVEMLENINKDNGALQNLF
jgi:hypothetical protein